MRSKHKELLKRTFPDFPYHFKSPRVRGWHRKEISQYLQASVALQYVTNWDMAVDIGAYCGAWSYAFVQRFKAVHTFEPSPTNFEYTKENLAGYTNVILHNEALMDRKRRGSYSEDAGNYGYIKLGAGSLTCNTLDSYQLPACDLIKIDAEGADTLVLRGAQKTIKKYSPVLIVEEKMEITGRYGLSPDAVATLLADWNYARVWAHSPDAIYVLRKGN